MDIEKESCELCKKNQEYDWKSGGVHDFRIKDGTLFFFDQTLGWEGIPIMFCPWCGRRLDSHLEKEILVEAPC